MRGKGSYIYQDINTKDARKCLKGIAAPLYVHIWKVLIHACRVFYWGKCLFHVLYELSSIKLYY